jgi:hypothetical protein
MQGIQSLMPGQASQQAPLPMPQQSSSTPGAMTGSLKNMPMEQLKMLFQNPQPGSPPLWAVISALAEKQKEAQAIQAAMGQGAMAQNAQMQQQPPVAAQVVQAAQGGIMQGYAGGGAVAFAGGTGPEGLPQENPEDLSDDPSLPLRERMARAQKRMALSRQQGIGRSFAERFPAPAESTTDTGDEMSRMLGRAPAPVPMSMRDTRGATPETVAVARNLGIGQPQQRQQRQQRQEAAQAAMATGIASPVEATGTPAPDRMAEIEAQGIAGIKSLQDIIRQQGNVDPRLAELREAAYKSSQDIAARRERDRQAMLEAGQKRYDDITDLLIGAAGGARGKTFGDVLSGAVGGAGAARTAKRAEFQKVQDAARQEQNAIDNLKQALADKRVADMSGDVNQRRQADMKVAEAELKISELRSGIQKERATQEDRAEQRQISREQMQSQERIAAANRAASAALRNLPGPEQQMVERVIKSLMDANPGMAYHEAYDKARGSGRGMDLKETSVELRALKDEEQQLLKRLEATYSSQERAPITARLEQISRDRVKLMGGTPTSAPIDGPITPKSQAEFNALPKGARYINPADGKEYIKN